MLITSGHTGRAAEWASNQTKVQFKVTVTRCFGCFSSVQPQIIKVQMFPFDSKTWNPALNSQNQGAHTTDESKITHWDNVDSAPENVDCLSANTHWLSSSQIFNTHKMWNKETESKVLKHQSGSLDPIPYHNNKRLYLPIIILVSQQHDHPVLRSKLVW